MMKTMILAAALLASSIALTPALAEEASMGDYVDVNGMRVYYEVSGEGEPIVALHGAHMNIDTMGEIIPLLAENHKVYAMEFQGHGRTSDIDRPITYENLADDVAGFMDAVGLEKADVFGYSMGAGAGLQLAVRHPEKVDQLIALSGGFSSAGMQPAMLEMIPQMSPEMFAPFKDQWTALAPDPEGFDAFIEKMIALEHEEFDWSEDIKGIEAPVLIIAGDADAMTLEHSVALFRLLGGGVMGDMGAPLPASRLAILPASSHTSMPNQTGLLMDIIEPFLAGEKPKGWFD